MAGTTTAPTQHPARMSRASPAARRMAAPGWVVIPLRVFLGVTFVYAGLQKLADKNFFKASSQSSIQSQLRAYSLTSPIGGLLHAMRHQAALIGLMIAVVELAVGLAALLGLWTRFAAVAGAALSLLFLLTVSWHSRPYYYGADIVFFFAWIPMALAGSGGVWSLEGLLAERARQAMKLPPVGPVNVEFAAIRRLCGAYDGGKCRLRRGAPCAVQPCPVLAAGTDLRPAVARELSRRELLAKSRFATVIAVNALGLGVVAAIVGRLIPSHQRNTAILGGQNATTSTTNSMVTTVAPASVPSTTASPASSSTAATSPALPAGTAIGSARAVPVGGAAQFANPTDGAPAYVIRNGPSSFKGFSAVCTHAGCTVDYTGKTFVCPCHGAVFAATSGQVLQGPARRPLPVIAIVEGPNGQLYAQ